MSIKKEFLLLLKSSSIGDGEPDLGEKLMLSFLDELWKSGGVPARIICLNSGIYLTTKGSQAADALKKFEDEGSEILSCATCLDYYGKKDQLILGKPTNMKDTVSSLLSFKMVIAP